MLLGVQSLALLLVVGGCVLTRPWGAPCLNPVSGDGLETGGLRSKGHSLLVVGPGEEVCQLFLGLLLGKAGFTAIVDEGGIIGTRSGVDSTLTDIAPTGRVPLLIVDHFIV